jgi:hypothetical protein
MIRTRDMSIEEIYNLMDSSDKIEEGMLCNWPSAVYIAIDEANHIAAAGSYNECSRNSVYIKAISRGCETPIICRASRILTQEAINAHNSALEKALLAKKALKVTPA